MSPVPVRARVTLAFAAAMAVLLAALGLFLWLELRARLDESIGDSLSSRLAEVSGLVATSQVLAGGDEAFGPGDGGETFVQVMDADGGVAYAGAASSRRPVLDAGELARAVDERTTLERDVAVIEGPARLATAPVAIDDRRGVVVVGASLEDRDEALAGLASLFAIGGPIALLLASLAGYIASGVALRPVDAMRSRAARISAGSPGEVLPVPRADDELRRLGLTLNAMLARLEAALERERRFVDDASHELRTPLALHKAELELALRYGEDSGQLRAAIASGIEEVDRLARLAEDMLVAARTGEGELALRTEDVDARALLASVAERFRVSARRADRTMVVSGDAPGLRGDRLRIEQAIGNLVDNALRHGAGEVALRCATTPTTVELHVTDHGEGFPAGFIDRAFERFSRADPARERGGAGLGLPIVATIASAHQGRAQATNRAEGGADVWIALPRDPRRG